MMNAVQTKEQMDAVGAALARLGFIRPAEATRLRTEGRWTRYSHRDGVAVGVRLPRGAKDFSKLIFEIEPRRGPRGTIFSYAERRVLTIFPFWESLVAEWINTQLPKAVARADEDEQRRQHASDIRMRATQVETAVREQLCTIYREAKPARVQTDGQGVCGVCLEVFVPGRTTEELMKALRQILDIPGVR